MCRVGFSNEAGCSFIAIGLSNDGKCVCNKTDTMPSCHAVVHFEMKMSLF